MPIEGQNERDSEIEAETEAEEIESLEDSHLEETVKILEEFPIPSESEKLIEDTSTLFSSVCGVCKHKNLTENAHLLHCEKCKELYCIHFTSVIDPRFCVGCLSKVEMTEQTIYKKSEHYNEDTDKLYTRTQKARQISFSGLDWLFYNRKISTLSDEELLLAIEYHRAIYNAMLYEREKRRIEHFHRNKDRQIKIPISSGTVTSGATTTVKKTKIVRPKQDKPADVQLRAILEQMLKAGVKPETLVKMLSPKEK